MVSPHTPLLSEKEEREKGVRGRRGEGKKEEEPAGHLFKSVFDRIRGGIICTFCSRITDVSVRDRDSGG